MFSRDFVRKRGLVEGDEALRSQHPERLRHGQKVDRGQDRGGMSLFDPDVRGARRSGGSFQKDGFQISELEPKLGVAKL